jgi:hypothetical protein
MGWSGLAVIRSILQTFRVTRYTFCHETDEQPNGQASHVAVSELRHSTVCWRFNNYGHRNLHVRAGFQAGSGTGMVMRVVLTALSAANTVSGARRIHSVVLARIAEFQSNGASRSVQFFTHWLDGGQAVNYK